MTMRIEFVEVGETVRFELHDVDPSLAQVLQQSFWDHQDGVWHRPYPASAPHLDRVRQHFRAHAEEMFRQMAYQRPVLWADALLAFADRARSAGIAWWLTGSVAACVRGVPLSPHDVDIMVDHDQIPTVSEAFADVFIEPLVDTGGWVTRDFGVLFLHARVDIASDPSALLDDPEPGDCGPYARDRLQVVHFRGHEILVPPLDLQVAVNRRRGRHERADLLQAHLDRGDSGRPGPDRDQVVDRRA
jgi:hypothetical protein